MMTAEQLYNQLDEQELAQLEMEGIAPGQRYAMPSEPVVNDVEQMQPEAGGMQLDPRNSALKRMFAKMPKTPGVPIVPGLNDHSNQNQSGQNWHESGGV